MDRVERLVLDRLGELPQGLREHIQRVEDIAAELARAHRVETERTQLCAQAHDLCRAMKGEELLRRARALGLRVLPVEERVPILLHGPVAAEMLRREGLADEGVYQGIYYHSTACPGMEPVGRVVFLADKLDPHKARRYPYLDELKGKAQGSLEQAMLEFLTREIASLLEAGHPVHPASVEARKELLELEG